MKASRRHSRESEPAGSATRSMPQARSWRTPEAENRRGGCRRACRRRRGPRVPPVSRRVWVSGGEGRATRARGLAGQGEQVGRPRQAALGGNSRKVGCKQDGEERGARKRDAAWCSERATHIGVGRLAPAAKATRLLERNRERALVSEKDSRERGHVAGTLLRRLEPHVLDARTKRVEVVVHLHDGLRARPRAHECRGHRRLTPDSPPAHRPPVRLTCSFCAGVAVLSAARLISLVKLAQSTRIASLAAAASSGRPHLLAAWWMVHAAERKLASAWYALSLRA
eukprot:scaffold118388_cov32-Tisochrysis_lutea.AAC.2